MKIVKTDFVAGAREAKGIVVIIDVFRAFSVACYCLDKGASSVYPVGKVEDALALKNSHENTVLIGEREGKKISGFDYGNSPTELQAVDLKFKNIIHTTHAGTQGLVNATKAKELLTGAFVNAKATINYIKHKSPALVTLVRMGWKAETPTDEDNLCAEYFESLLLEKEFDETSIKPELQVSSFSQRFFDVLQPWNPESDFDLCLALNRFNFAVSATRDNENILSLNQLTDY